MSNVSHKIEERIKETITHLSPEKLEQVAGYAEQVYKR